MSISEGMTPVITDIEIDANELVPMMNHAALSRNVATFSKSGCPLFGLGHYCPSPNSTFSKIFNTRSQETVDVCLEMFGCLQDERTIAIRKRKFLNKFCVIHGALCRVFVATAKTELESCCTDA